MRGDSRFVVDASVVLKWYLQDEDHVAQAVSLYEGWVEGRIQLTAPNFIRYEVANSLETARIQGRIDAGQASIEIDNFMVTGIYLDGDGDDLVRAAIDASRRYGVAPYDGLYLALAEETDRVFVTADRRLHRRVRDQVPYVRWLATVSA